MADQDLSSLRRIYAALARGSAEELFDAVAHNIEWSVPESLPWGGTHHGPDGIQSVFEVLQEHADAWWDVDDFLDAEDLVFVLGRLNGRAFATGREFEAPFVHVWGMSDGVPVSFRSYLDTAVIADALRR